MSSNSDEKFLLRILLDTVECHGTHDLLGDKFSLVGTSQSGLTKADLQKSNQQIATPIIKTKKGKTEDFPTSAASLLFADYVKPGDFVAITLDAFDVDFMSPEEWKNKYEPLAAGLADLTKDAVDKVVEKKGAGGEVSEEAVIDGSAIKAIVDIIAKDVPSLIGKIMAIDAPDKLGSWDLGWRTAKDWRDMAKKWDGKYEMSFRGVGIRGKWDYVVNYVVTAEG